MKLSKYRLTLIFLGMCFVFNAGYCQIPDLNRFTFTERQSLESVCRQDKLIRGPTAYADCLNLQILAYEKSTQKNSAIAQVEDPKNNSLNKQQNNLPSCQGSDVTRWNNCNGEATVKGETIYVGEWKNGKYDGKGSITLQSGEQFIGWFKNGNITGWGEYAFPKEFLNKNKLKDCSDTNKNNWDSCFGKRVYTDGDNYVGEWKDGKFHGVGLYTWRPMNDSYAGEWSNGMRNGKGISKSKILNGETMEITDRSQYVGEFKDNKYYGNGNLLNIKNGFIENSYTGEFKDNLKQGLGTLAFDDGRIWKGQWFNDEVHGKLVKYRSDGGIEEQGIYKQGKLINSIIIDPNFANYYTDQNKDHPFISGFSRYEFKINKFETKDKP